MKKLILFLCLAIVLCGCENITPEAKQLPQEKVDHASDEKVQDETQTHDYDIILPLFSTKTKAQNKMWVGTFQLAFNDMKNNVLQQDIYFIDEKPTEEIIGLNKEEFNSSMLNESSYYTSYGKTSFEAKEKIKKDIKQKFNETSDIIDKANWDPGEGKYYAYAMLKKQFEFLNEFDILKPEKFNNSQKEYQYFGIDNKSENVLGENVRVLFYNSENDFAINLLTKNGDIIYLYRNDKNDSLKNLYDEMLSKKSKYKGSDVFLDVDTLKVPNIKFDKMREYRELCNKTIKGTDDLYFSDAIETLQFELDNKGGKVKSEALVMTMKNEIREVVENEPRHFDFDKTFNLFLIDSGKKEPYMALRIYDLEEFVEQKQ